MSSRTEPVPKHAEEDGEADAAPARSAAAAAAKGDDDGERRGGGSKNAKKVPFLKLFAFADGLDCVLMALGSVAACVHGASVPVFFVFFGKLINIMGIAYLFPASVSHRVAKYSLDFVYLGIVMLFSSWIEVACWMHTGERQAAKMRVAYLRSMLDQDIGIFDTESSTAEVIGAITGDIIVVQDAISEKISRCATLAEISHRPPALPSLEAQAPSATPCVGGRKINTGQRKRRRQGDGQDGRDAAPNTAPPP